MSWMALWKVFYLPGFVLIPTKDFWILLSCLCLFFFSFLQYEYFIQSIQGYEKDQI